MFEPSKSSLEAAAEAAAKVNAVLIAKGKLRPWQLSQQEQQTPRPKLPSGTGLVVAEVEINDVPIQCRNFLTRGNKQEQISHISGAAVSTRGRFITAEERINLKPGERPLYLCVKGPTTLSVETAVHQINYVIHSYTKLKSTSRFSPTTIAMSQSMMAPPPALGPPPPTLGQLPPTLGQLPPTLGQQLPTLGQPPSTLDQPHPTAGQPPPTLDQPPPTLGQPPLTLGQPPPVLGQQHIALGQPPPAFGQPLSTLCQPPHTLGQLPPTLGQPPLGPLRPPILSQPPPPLMSITTQQPPGSAEIQERLFIGLENTPPEFDVTAKIVGVQGSYLHHIVTETGARVMLRGQGSGFLEAETGREAFMPLHLHIQHQTIEGFTQAKQLAENLIATVLEDFQQFQAASMGGVLIPQFSVDIAGTIIPANIQHQNTVSGTLLIPQQPAPASMPPPSASYIPIQGSSGPVSISGAVASVSAGIPHGVAVPLPGQPIFSVPPPPLASLQTAPGQATLQHQTVVATLPVDSVSPALLTGQPPPILLAQTQQQPQQFAVISQMLPAPVEFTQPINVVSPSGQVTQVAAALPPGSITVPVTGLPPPNIVIPSNLSTPRVQAVLPGVLPPGATPQLAQGVLHGQEQLTFIPGHIQAGHESVPTHMQLQPGHIQFHTLAAHQVPAGQMPPPSGQLSPGSGQLHLNTAIPPPGQLTANILMAPSQLMANLGQIHVNTGVPPPVQVPHSVGVPPPVSIVTVSMPVVCVTSSVFTMCNYSPTYTVSRMNGMNGESEQNGGSVTYTGIPPPPSTDLATNRPPPSKVVRSRSPPRRRFREEKEEDTVPENILGYQHGPPHLTNLVSSSPTPQRQLSANSSHHHHEKSHAEKGGESYRYRHPSSSQSHTEQRSSRHHSHHQQLRRPPWEPSSNVHKDKHLMPPPSARLSQGLKRSTSPPDTSPSERKKSRSALAGVTAYGDDDDDIKYIINLQKSGRDSPGQSAPTSSSSTSVPGPGPHFSAQPQGYSSSPPRTQQINAGQEQPAPIPAQAQVAPQQQAVTPLLQQEQPQPQQLPPNYQQNVTFGQHVHTLHMAPPLHLRPNPGQPTFLPQQQHLLTTAAPPELAQLHQHLLTTAAPPELAQMHQQLLTTAAPQELGQVHPHAQLLTQEHILAQAPGISQSMPSLLTGAMAPPPSVCTQTIITPGPHQLHMPMLMATEASVAQGALQAEVPPGSSQTYEITAPMQQQVNQAAAATQLQAVAVDSSVFLQHISVEQQQHQQSLPLQSTVAGTTFVPVSVSSHFVTDQQNLGTLPQATVPVLLPPGQHVSLPPPTHPPPAISTAHGFHEFPQYNSLVGMGGTILARFTEPLVRVPPPSNVDQAPVQQIQPYSASEMTRVWPADGQILTPGLSMAAHSPPSQMMAPPPGLQSQTTGAPIQTAEQTNTLPPNVPHALFHSQTAPPPLHMQAAPPPQYNATFSQHPPHVHPPPGHPLWGGQY